MSYRNAINLTDDELDKPVYRIMPVYRLLEGLESKQQVLVKPYKWDDPFENMLLSSNVKLSSGESGTMPELRDSVYGQCWTLHKETDAMWRIYSNDNNGVKIKSTPRKLLDALKVSDPRFSDIQCFIGKVSYLNQKGLVRTLQSIDLFNTNGSGVAESLLYKRLEFNHEKEIRLIYTGKNSGDIHSYNIDPFTLYDEIIFDPRMNKELYKAYKMAITGKGYTNRIGQSVLYRHPPALSITL